MYKCYWLIKNAIGSLSITLNLNKKNAISSTRRVVDLDCYNVLCNPI